MLSSVKHFLVKNFTNCSKVGNLLLVNEFSNSTCVVVSNFMHTKCTIKQSHWSVGRCKFFKAVRCCVNLSISCLSDLCEFFVMLGSSNKALTCAFTMTRSFS